MSDVTRILNAIEQGDARAVDGLIPLVYEELSRLLVWLAFLQQTRHCLLVNDVKSDILVHSELSENRGLGR